MAYFSNADASHIGGTAAGPWYDNADVGLSTPAYAVQWKPLVTANFASGDMTPSTNVGAGLNSLTDLGSGVFRTDFNGGTDRDDPATGATFKLNWPATPPQAWVGNGTETISWRITPQQDAPALGTIVCMCLADNNGDPSAAGTTMLGVGCYSFSAGNYRTCGVNRTTFSPIAVSWTFANGGAAYSIATFLGRPGDANNVGVQPLGYWQLSYYAYKSVTDDMTAYDSLTATTVSGKFRPVLFVGFDGVGAGQTLDWKIEWCIGGNFPRTTFGS